MKIIKNALLFILFISYSFAGHSQELREYVIKKTDVPLTIDGFLTEPEWSAVPYTSIFVDSESGDSVTQNARAQMLWDDQYLYVGFSCEDFDVWSSYEDRDANLWEQENVEIFCDPDGDKHNYIEIEVSPLETIFDQTIDRSWLEGSNNEDKTWDLEGMLVAATVDGTLNEPNDRDSAWYCEIAIPFDELASFALPLPSPPLDGDQWRIQLARYDRNHDDEGNLPEPDQAEPAIWNPTEQPSFHVPEKFGRVLFSSESASKPSADHFGSFPAGTGLTGIYPNPCSSHCNIEFEMGTDAWMKIEILNSQGSVIDKLYNQFTPGGSHSIRWEAGHFNPGIYFCRISTKEGSINKKILLIP